MSPVRTSASILALVLLGFPVLPSCTQEASDERTQERARVAGFTDSITVPESPERTYDAATGDISAWWDHSMSGAPYKLSIDPRPGGAFLELFNEKGDGALHATVILAERGKRLRFEGPLGLSGLAVTVVTTYEFRPLGADSTVLTYHVRMSGELPEGVADIVRTTWHHFMAERFKPYIESGRHRDPAR